MKNLLKKSVIAALVLANGAGYAQVASVSADFAEAPVEVESLKKSAVSGYVKENGFFRLAIDNPEGIRYRISVTDERGKVWYEETTSADRFRRLMDVSSPAAERLKVVVKGGEEETAYIIERTKARFFLAKKQNL